MQASSDDRDELNARRAGEGKPSLNEQEYFAQREAALTAHATQIDPAGAFLASSVQDQRDAWPTEEFELAQTRVKTHLPEDDLFAGIEEEAAK